MLPGAYVQVALPLKANQSLVVPANALLFRKEGTQVAVVDAQGNVRLRPVAVGRNFGEQIELLNGIAGNDRPILNSTDSLADGDKVLLHRRQIARRQALRHKLLRARTDSEIRQVGGARGLDVERSAAGCMCGRTRLSEGARRHAGGLANRSAVGRPGTPDDISAKGPWWSRFGDAKLNALQEQALAGSQTLAVANARLAQARAVFDGGRLRANVDFARAGYDVTVANYRACGADCDARG